MGNQMVTSEIWESFPAYFVLNQIIPQAIKWGKSFDLGQNASAIIIVL